MIKNSIDKYTYSLAVEELRLRGKNKKDPINLSKNSLYYLQIVYYNPGCTISDIAGLIGVSKSAVTMKISSLEKEGLVLKKSSEEDKRSQRIYFSKKAEETYEAVLNLKDGIFKGIQENFSEGEIDSFCRILNEISTEMLNIEDSEYKLNIGE